MNVLSLFDGMSCGQIALNKANIVVDNYYAAEIDKFAISVAKENYPDTIHLGSVTEWRDWDIDWKSIDLLIGGSPCQGFSFSGKQLAFDDERSQLFFVYIDILNHIREFNSNVHFMLENVKMHKDHLYVISHILDVKPILINSSLVSAQSRQRYYWTSFNVTQPEDKGIFWKDVMEHGATDCMIYSEKAIKWLTATEKRISRYSEYTKDCERKMQMVEASHYKGYSNQRCFSINDGCVIRYVSPLECERLQTVPDGYTASVSRSQRYKMLGNGWTIDVITHLFHNMIENNEHRSGLTNQERIEILGSQEKVDEFRNIL